MTKLIFKDPQICESHRKELLRFLLLKTAAVRSGVKPGELLRIQHCYQGRNSEGFQFCLYRKDILEILKLDYIELRDDPQSSLVLFYHRETLSSTLALPENRIVLNQFGYPQGDSPESFLKLLQERFTRESLPHEVGVFIGYPAKDVIGFINKLPKTPIHKGDWQVFGDAGESLARMNLYRHAEQIARSIFDACDDLQTFFNHISSLNITRRNIANG